jgi:hypothetical protein
LTNGVNDVYSIYNIVTREVKPMKPWAVRLPEDVLEWLREKAARETIRQKRVVSMNSLAVEILTKAMKADQKKGGDR